MPVIEKQTIRPNTVPVKAKAPTGSVLSEAIDVSQLTEEYVKLVLYGQNRVGKTTLACQAPKPLLLVAFEPDRTGGAVSVKKVPGVKLLRLQSTEKAVRLAREIAQGAPCDLPGEWNGRLYQSLVVDSATSLQDVVLKELMDLPDVPVQLNWGLVSEDGYRERSEKTKEVLRAFTDLPCHVIFTAKERDHTPNTGNRRSKLITRETMESFFATDLGGQTAGWLQDSCGYIARLYIAMETVTRKVAIPGKKELREVEEETGRNVHRLRTLYQPPGMGSPGYAAGFRSCTPEAVPEWIDRPTWQLIEKVIRGERIKEGHYPA